MAKFCGNCGYRMQDDDRVCGQCGTMVVDLEDLDNTMPTYTSQPNMGSQAAPKSNKEKKVPPKFIVLGATVLVALIVLIAVLTSGPRTVNLNDYVEFTFTGYDGYGHATVSFDETAFLEDHGEKIEFVETGTMVDSLTGYISAAESMRLSCVSGNLNINKGLSNGDEITYHWTCNDKLAEATFDVDLKYEDIKVKVKDLVELSTVDLFADVSLELSGFDRYSYIDVISEGKEAYLEDIFFTPNTYQGVVNGDEVTVTASLSRYSSVEINEYFAEEYGVIPAALEKTYTVSGLAVPEKFDPFQYVEVSFSGISPAGTASVNVIANSEFMYDVEAYLDKAESLTNGDEVTVRLEAPYWGNTADLEEYWAWNYGLAPEALEKTYTVEGLGCYVETLADIPNDTLEKMIDQAEDAMNASVAESWRNPGSLDGMEYQGAYLLTPKDGGFSTDHKNVVYIIHKIDVTNKVRQDEESVDHSFSYYSFTAFYDLVIETDGTCQVSVNNYSTPSATFDIDSLTYHGYQTMEDLYRNCVTKNIENYKHESNVTEN